MTVLGVFFTRGVSLEKWLDAGIYDREVSIYRQHLHKGTLSRVYWFTYGFADRECAQRMVSIGRMPAEIVIVQCPSWLRWFGRGASAIYSMLLPVLVCRYLRRCDLYKTNQMDGAVAALISSWLWRRPFYVRTGYTLSRVVEKVFPRNWLRKAVAWLTEYLAFRFCSTSSVTSQYDLDYVVTRYKLSKRAPLVVGNFVDTEIFNCQQIRDKSARLVFVGRLSPEKNLEMAIRACVLVGVGLDIVGAGPQRSELEHIAAEIGADVGWLGIIANDELPRLLNRYRYFILPSYWEGMPKALLEAMASGLVCIGNNTTGINEIIEDGLTGYLSSGSSAPELADAIKRAIQGNYELISKAAREFICNQFSITAIAAKEAEIFSELRYGKTHCSGAKP